MSEAEAKRNTLLAERREFRRKVYAQDNATKAQWRELAEESISDAGYWKREARTAIAQRDELLEALRDCVTTKGALAERNHEYALKRLTSISETAKAVIANVEKAREE